MMKGNTRKKLEKGVKYVQLITKSKRTTPVPLFWWCLYC